VRGERARLGGIASQKATAFERLEMRLDGRRGRKTDAFADLPHGRRVAALGGVVADDLEDALLFFCGGAFRHDGCSLHENRRSIETSDGARPSGEAGVADWVKLLVWPNP